jgi:hypothetical protein
LVETSIKISSGGPEEESDDDEEDEETSTLRAQNGLSVEEKMRLWYAATLETPKSNDSLANFHNQEDEDEEIEDYAISHYPDAWKFLTNGHDYQWLLGRVRTEILLTKREDTVAENIRREILRGLASSKTVQGHRYINSMAKFEIHWDLPKFLKEHYPGEEHLQLGSLITIVGFETDAQALTCAEYMRQVWPATGLETLGALQQAIENGLGNCLQCNSNFCSSGYLSC